MTGAASPGVAALAYAASLALHGSIFLALLVVRPPPAPQNPPVEVEIRELTPPDPPRDEPPRPEPTRIARAPQLRPPLRQAPPPAEPEAPPPPGAPAPQGTLAKPTPVRIGVSMSSTTTAGGFAAPVGNTAYGQVPPRAEDPASVEPYRSERYVPPSQVTSLPVPVQVDIPKSEYPDEARRLGIEGAVKLRLLVDEEGRVQDAKVLSDPGHGLGPRAVRNAKRYLRFRPALRAGKPVATEIPFTIAFELD